jgi:hypothetical protein
MWSRSVAKKQVKPLYISDRKLFVLAKKHRPPHHNHRVVPHCPPRIQHPVAAPPQHVWFHNHGKRTYHSLSESAGTTKTPQTCQKQNRRSHITWNRWNQPHASLNSTPLLPNSHRIGTVYTNRTLPRVATATITAKRIPHFRSQRKINKLCNRISALPGNSVTQCDTMSEHVQKAHHKRSPLTSPNTQYAPPILSHFSLELDIPFTVPLPHKNRKVRGAANNSSGTPPLNG